MASKYWPSCVLCIFRAFNMSYHRQFGPINMYDWVLSATLLYYSLSSSLISPLQTIVSICLNFFSILFGDENYSEEGHLKMVKRTPSFTGLESRQARSLCLPILNPPVPITVNINSIFANFLFAFCHRFDSHMNKFEEA